MNLPPHKDVGGVLLLYRRPVSRWFRDVATIDDHIAAFREHSRFSVTPCNTELGFPRGLRGTRFDAIVLHYSLFGADGADYPFSPLFERHLDSSPDAYKVAFFHDEHTACQKRFAFLNRHRIDCVFTLLEPPEFDKVYGTYTEVPKLVSHLPGYVSETAIAAARAPRPPEAERPLDVGFRARPLPPYMGTDEKSEMGLGFAARAEGTGLVADIEVSHQSMIPGRGWFDFMGQMRTVLGVESGTTCFDLEDEVLDEYRRLAAERGPENITVDDLRRSGVLDRWEGVVRYRTIGPRNFEAAAMGVCQVLREGRYSGVMEPMRHYIPVKEDFSNFDEVVEMIRDPALRAELAGNAHRDLVASGDYSFARLIESFDGVLAEAGIEPGPSRRGDEATMAVRRSAPARAVQGLRSTLSYHPVISRVLWRVSRPVLAAYRRLARARAR